VKDIIQRASTGIIFVGVVVGAILWDYYTFAALFAVVVILGLLEFYKLLNTDGTYPQKFLGTVSGAAMFILNCGVHFEFLKPNMVYLNFAFFFIIFAVELFRRQSNPFTNLAFTFFSLIYIALPISLLVNISSIGEETYEPWFIMGYLIMVWVNDSGALATGMSLGKHKLFARVSPKKTWEGAIGGAFFTLCFSYILFRYIGILGLQDWLVIGVIVAVMGTFGDLVESLLKRSIFIKDSGSILPGHGGVLDRFDSVFLSSPFVFVYLELFY
jgi:phosphatidate cytidylyltransferase